MAKLYFRYGAVDSAKTLNLLAVHYNYSKVGKKALLITPRIDTRFGLGVVKSRAGLEAPADLVIDEGYRLAVSDIKGFDAVLADEAQFMSAKTIDSLRWVVDCFGIPVMAYGLRTDFLGRLFPGSKRLFELADEIEEVKNLCSYCTRKATHNLRIDAEGNPCYEGNTVELGDSCYKPVCHTCYTELIANAKSKAKLQQKKAE